MDTTALMQSCILTLVGMIVVFLFMGLLILLVKLFLVISFRFFPDKEDCPEVSVHKSEEHVVAAIATTIHQANTASLS